MLHKVPRGEKKKVVMSFWFRLFGALKVEVWCTNKRETFVLSTKILKDHLSFQYWPTKQVLVIGISWKKTISGISTFNLHYICVMPFLNCNSHTSLFRPVLTIDDVTFLPIITNLSDTSDTSRIYFPLVALSFFISLSHTHTNTHTQFRNSGRPTVVATGPLHVHWEKVRVISCSCLHL